MKTEETQIEGLKKEKGVVFFFFLKGKRSCVVGRKEFRQIARHKDSNFQRSQFDLKDKTPQSRPIGFYEKL